ncbi:MSS1 [Candida oxycetoniae]|uniref:MSS1 n=1 Tax=Candida oxycetoniae TaxID=497107 RepID=A0AAI9SSV6_9ASCO|nr:MSS1 [Candida oxycetoniae]KAI3402413.2 MSS1 [Candida oxycetoniae]
MFLRLWQKRLYNTVSLTQPTIFALSTHLAKSAIAVVRISGPQSLYIYNKLTQTQTKPKPRTASVRKLYSPNTLQILDEALTLFFPQPRTYTGLDILELHLHGGVAIIRSVLESIRQLHDPDNGIFIRQAEPGEFSKQAFANGKYDLTALEGISDMINAVTESQRVASLASMSGQTKNIFAKWRQDLLENVADLTALVDFGEDQTLEESEHFFENVARNIEMLEAEVRNYLKKVRSSEVLLKGIQLALVGPPNAGKSSLLNTLSNTDTVIVSDIAGTTRDVIDIPLEVGGYKVVMGDTAGIRSLSEADHIEQEGIRRAKSKSQSADFVMLVIDPTQKEDNIAELKKLVTSLKECNKQMLVVLNKEDLIQSDRNKVVEKYSSLLNLDKDMFHFVSCRTGSNIDKLRDTIVEKFKVIAQSDTADPIIVSSRVQDILEHDVLYGFEGFTHWKGQDDVVLATECLRQAIEGIGKITGEAIGVEEVLGVVFSNFCIGK